MKIYENLPDLELNLSTSFNFLTVAQMGPKKDLESTVLWFLQEFEKEDVGLVIKTNMAKNTKMLNKSATKIILYTRNCMEIFIGI